MLLLSDEVDIARRRDGEMRLVQGQVRKGREEVVREVRRLLGGGEGDEEREGQELGSGIGRRKEGSLEEGGGGGQDVGDGLGKEQVNGMEVDEQHRVTEEEADEDEDEDLEEVGT